MELPTHEPPETTQQVVYSFGPEWFWFIMTLAVAGLIVQHQASYLHEALMPLPLLSWIVVPTWAGWLLLLPLIGFMVFFSSITRVIIDQAAGSVTSESFSFHCFPLRRSRRALQEVAAIRCSQEGLKTGRIVGGPVVAVFKAVLLVLIFVMFASPGLTMEYRALQYLYPVAELLILAIAFVGSVVLEWGTPTAHLLFMDGKTWTMTRGADHEVYRQARRIARLAGVRVIGQSPPPTHH